MNRQQAEHILDAYVDMHRECGGEDACVASLRKIILDAMTEYKTTYINGNTLPPWATVNPPKPLVTYTNGIHAECTGIDPLFRRQTTG